MHAIANSGWNPLNLVLLNHPSLQDAKPGDSYDHRCILGKHTLSSAALASSFVASADVASKSLPALNVDKTEGMAALVLDQLFTARMKNKGVEEAYKKRQMEDIAIRKSIKESKKLSSGILTKNGVYALDNSDFVAGFCDRIEEKSQEAEGRAKK